MLFTTGLEMTADVRTVYGKADSAKVCADAILTRRDTDRVSESGAELARQLDDRDFAAGVVAAPICAQ